MSRFIKRKRKKLNSFVEPDEIFLDSENIPQFDRQQFEGRIERPIAKSTIRFLGLSFLALGLIFTGRLGFLQVSKGEAYFTRSEKNNLKKKIIFTDRGSIYDRNKNTLAWNVPALDSESVPHRAYVDKGGFSHLLGYVSYPMKDKSGFYWQPDFVAKDGMEKQYDSVLRGQNGTKITETNALGEVQSENTVNNPQRGKDIILSVDSGIQGKLFEAISSAAEQYRFSGGSGIIMDVKTGEIIAETSFPEYDSEILSFGKDAGKIKKYLNDSRKPFLDRNLSGLYAPGSIVKPFLAVGALAEGVIDASKQILSTGSISIPNPYFPEKKSVFKDWKAHGWVDMKTAIAVSSDVYFYEIGGGFQDQKGLGISNIEKYAKLFGIGEKTGIDLQGELSGVIPSPEWKTKNFPGDPWRVGDTYHTAIGQYGFLVTPAQMVRAVASLANGGNLPTPHFLKDTLTKESKSVDIDQKYFDVAKEGMRESVTIGTASGLYVPYVEVAAKTGTAQVGINNTKANSWVMGFFPYKEPKYAFVILMEGGPSSNSVGATFIMRQLMDWMSQNTPEYFK